MDVNNIQSIDSYIMDMFQDQKLKLPRFKEQLKQLEKYTQNPNLHSRVRDNLVLSCKDLKTKIEDIESDKQINIYIISVAELLDQYRELLKVPIQDSFMGKPTKDNKAMKKVVAEYMKIAKQYIPLDIPSQQNKSHKIICDNCPNKKDFEIIDGNIYVCTQCFSQQIVMKQTSSYKDIDRINTSAKYTYARNIHFRDCINQYQGKQNCTIEKEVYDNLEEQFKNHYLLTDSPIREIRFKKITKEHIMIFLKSLKYTKHYENVNLIHYNLTGVKPDDIGYLEDQLLIDFDILTDLYDKQFKHLSRKNFINTQYVLYQLLMRHKHPCKKENFTVLKTFERELFHDGVVRELFEQLDWNFTSF